MIVRTRPFSRFLLGDLGAAQEPSFLRETGENVITRRTSFVVSHYAECGVNPSFNARPRARSSQ